MVVDIEKEKQIYLKILDELLDKFELPYSGAICENDEIRPMFLRWEYQMGEAGIGGYVDSETDELIYESTYFDNISHPLLTFFSEFGDWTLNRGWCRIVLSAVDSDYVLKIPANFLCGRRVDFNENEFEMYQRALRDGWDGAFAACYKAGSYRGIPLLLMEKIDVDEEHNENISYATLEREFAETFDGNEEQVQDALDSYECGGDSETIMRYLQSVYGEEFIDWCDVNDLADIHSGNFGFKNCDVNHPIICDYASY